MRWIFLFLCLLVHCSDPVAPDRGGVLLPQVLSVEPQGPIARVTRFAVTISAVAPVTLTLLSGRATEADVSAIARARPSAALSARMIPHFDWSEATTTFAQPTEVLPLGELSLIVAVEKLAPSVHLLTVTADGVLATRVDPGSSATYCVDRALPPLPARVELAPAGSARVNVRAGVPCFELLPDDAGGPLVAPPSIGSLLIDPAPIGLSKSGPDPEPCAEDASLLSPLCARVLDDRLVLVGDVASPRLVLGTVGGKPLVAPLGVGARLPVLGFSGASKVVVDLFVRDLRAEWHVKKTITMASPRRHIVVNEVLSHAPSGSSSQRFVEIANDGKEPAWLGDLFLVDGDDRRPLPDLTLAASALALIVPHGFIDGLAGETPPPSGTLHLEVDALRLTGAIAITEASGALSNFPASASTRTISRGRRSTSTPDDAPDAFGWDAKGKATPGRENALE